MGKPVGIDSRRRRHQSLGNHLSSKDATTSARHPFADKMILALRRDSQQARKSFDQGLRRRA